MARPNPHAPLGQGGRFAALEQKLARRPGVTDPAALAAAIGASPLGVPLPCRRPGRRPAGPPVLLPRLRDAPAMRRLRFWWQSRRVGFPVRLGARPSNVATYSQWALLAEKDTRRP